MITLQEQKEKLLNTNAFNGVSFDPEKRLDSFIEEYEFLRNTIIFKAKEIELDEEKTEKLLNKFFNLAYEYLCAESRCLSWAITGPAKFPVSRNGKRVDLAQAKLNRYVDFFENIDKILKRITRKGESEDSKKERWLKQIEELKARQEMMKDVNSLIRKGKKDEAEKKYGIVIEKNCWGNYGFEGYSLRNNLANIKRLEEQVKRIDSVREEKKEQGFDFEGGSVIFDEEEIRFNIVFDEIPDVEVRTRLKSNGFKWSPKRKAWTRGAKTISIKTIKEILGV